MAVEPVSWRQVLSAPSGVPVPYRERTCATAVHVRGIAIRTCRSVPAHVAVRLPVAPRPPGRLRRAGTGGRGRSDPPSRGLGAGSGRGVDSHPAPARQGVAPSQQSLPEGRRAPPKWAHRIGSHRRPWRMTPSVCRPSSLRGTFAAGWTAVWGFLGGKRIGRSSASHSLAVAATTRPAGRAAIETGGFRWLCPLKAGEPAYLSWPREARPTTGLTRGSAPSTPDSPARGHRSRAATSTIFVPLRHVRMAAP